MGNIAAAVAASKSSGSSSITFLIVIVLLFGALYFLMIKPQRRRQQQAMQQQRTVQPGAQVRTTAGMYATVVSTDGDDVVLEVAPGVEVRYMKRAIMEVISPGDEPVAEEPMDSEYATDDVGSSHDAEPAEPMDDDHASSNGTKAKSDTDVF
ncbi:MAG TPA: preprotein translocase subunit YajC [Streptosporangiaceae bacterium]|nr:preprotein translocase subunit YajC [Streptosporangiaceae bacterium]